MGTPAVKWAIHHIDLWPPAHQLASQSHPLAITTLTLPTMLTILNCMMSLTEGMYMHTWILTICGIWCHCLRSRLSLSSSPFHSSSRAQLTSISHGNLYVPPHSDYTEEVSHTTLVAYQGSIFLLFLPSPLLVQGYQSLPRGGFAGTMDSVFTYGFSPSNTISPPPAPKSCATDV